MKTLMWALAIVPSVALAEFDDLSQAQCEAMLGFVANNLGSETGGDVVAEQGSCVVTGFATDAVDAQRIMLTADRIVLSATGAEPLLAGRAPLEAVRLQVSGIRIQPYTGFAEMDYLFSIQQVRNVIDADVSVSWDPETGLLEMDMFEVRFPYDQRLFASFVAENADLSSFAALEASLMQLEMTDMRLEATTYGLFEAYAAPVLINGLLAGSDDPEAEMQRIKAQGIAALQALPEDLWTEGSRAALEALVQDMPMPNGSIALQVTAEPGIGMGRAAPFALLGAPESVEDLRPVLGGITIDATYDRVPLE